MDTKSASQYILLAGLLLAMVLTRGPWIDPWVHLRDATLAVFFLAGMFFRGYAVPSVLLATAGLTDLAAVQSGVSAWCFSAAYPFLIPTYLSLWWAGRSMPGQDISTLYEAIQGSLRLLAAGLMAFIISTGSFHWLSGRYDGIPVMDQVTTVTQYLPDYLGGAFLYVGIFMVSKKMWTVCQALAGRLAFNKVSQG